MAKQFFYVCAGLFLIIAAAQFGARRAEADWTGSGFVVAVASEEAAATAWTSLGEAYRKGVTDASWSREPSMDLPVAPGDVKMLEFENGNYGLLVTHGDVVWMYYGATW